LMSVLRGDAHGPLRPSIPARAQGAVLGPRSSGTEHAQPFRRTMW
jgi:hypothetical protein